MPNSCFNFLKGQDAFGSGVSINHKGESGYGTVAGGGMSLCTNFCVVAFISI